MNDKNKVNNLPKKNKTDDCCSVLNEPNLDSLVVAYQKPELICYGDVRDITLGPSPGFGESGAGVFFFQP